MLSTEWLLLLTSLLFGSTLAAVPTTLNCSSVSVQARATDKPPCLPPQTVTNEFIADTCMSVYCNDLPDGAVAAAGVSDYSFVVKSGGTCSWTDSYVYVPSYSVCGSAAPHTSFLDVHRDDVLADFAVANDVSVFGSSSNDIAVATTEGLTLLRADDSLGFNRVGVLPGSYTGVLAAAHDADVMYALWPRRFDIVNLLPPQNPTVLGTVELPVTKCDALALYTAATPPTRIVYVSCSTDGVLAVDASVDGSPALLSSTPVVAAPLNSEVRDAVVDVARSILFVMSDDGVYMYSLAAPSSPSLLTSKPSVDPVQRAALGGTNLFVAVGTNVLIFDTSSGTSLVLHATCCAQGMTGLHLIDVAVYEDLVFAVGTSNDRLLVIDVSDVTAPYYVGHRDLPTGYSQGKRVVVAKLNDGFVRVFDVAGAGGLMVFSDTPPEDAPTPATPMPAPPMLPPDCSSLYLHDPTSNSDNCATGDVLMSEHTVEACMQPVCASMQVSWNGAGIDGAANAVLIKSGSTCSFGTYTGTPERYICGPAPPHSTYLEQYDDGFLPAFSRTNDVCILHEARDEILVANSVELSVLVLTSNGRFTKTGALPVGYIAVEPSKADSSLVYGVQPHGLDIIDASNPSKPSVVGSVTLPSFSCGNIAQFNDSVRHIAYIACSNEGVFAVDVSTSTQPVVLGFQKSVVKASSGTGKGLLVDQARKLLFQVTYGETVHMYNVADAEAPVEVATGKTGAASYEMAMDGTVLFVAAKTTLRIFQTAGSASLTELSWCCHYGPDLFLVGLVHYNGLIYASDHKGVSDMVVMNVTDPTQPYYIGHRAVPGGSAGKEGIDIATLSDMTTRVFMAVDHGGVIVFSDVPPAVTDAPPTKAPPPPPHEYECSDFDTQVKVPYMPACSGDRVLMSKHVVEGCLTTLCGALPDGAVVQYDGPNGNFLTKSGIACSFGGSSLPATHAVCGRAAPHVSFFEVQAGVFQSGAKVREVCILGSDKNDIAVATNKDVTILRAEESTGFTPVARIAGDFMAVVGSLADKDVLLALKPNGFSIIDLYPPEDAKVISTVSLPSSACHGLTQHKTASSHYAYATCHGEGVFAIDITDSTNISVVGGGMLFKPASGNPKGAFVEVATARLYVGTEGGNSGTHMYDISNPLAPIELGFQKTSRNSFEIFAKDNIVYVVQDDTLEIFDGSTGTLTHLSSCCPGAPSMYLVGVDFYDSMIYASDHAGAIVMVMNVSDPSNPYFMGHKDAMTGVGGKEGIAVGALGDGIVRVFQADDGGGLVVFSDVRPPPTPVPATPMPSPPRTPPDCSSLYIHDASATGLTCASGDTLMGEHVVEACQTEVCSRLQASSSAAYDGGSNAVISKDAGGTCSLTTASGVTNNVCGSSPPYTTYLEAYDDGFLPAFSRTNDVCALPDSQDEVVVATDRGLVVMQVKSDRSLRAVGFYDAGFVAVIGSEMQRNVVLGVNGNGLQLIDTSVPALPTKLGSVSVPSGKCGNLEQMEIGANLFVFVSCNSDGIFLIDVSTATAPVLMNGGAAVAKPSTGSSKGLFVDEQRKLLFVTTTGPGLHMYNVTDPVAPAELFVERPDHAAYEVVLRNTILYVGADNTLEIYQTADSTGKLVLSQLSWCCHYAPDMFIVGIDELDGVVYASDHGGNGFLTAMNVTDPHEPYYMGHREFPPATGGRPLGKEGVFLAKMSDGIVRVFVAADHGGLMVFSDVKPEATPAPLTPTPPQPPQPMDCDHLIVQPVIQYQPDCPLGKVLTNKHVLEQCNNNICSDMPDGAAAQYDGTSNSFFKKTGTSCSIVSDAQASASHSVCGTAAPHIAYYNVLKDGILLPDSKTREVCVLGSDSNDIAVATSKGLSILRSSDSIGFVPVSHVPGDFMACEGSPTDADVLFAVKPNGFMIISLYPPSQPTVLGSASISSGACHGMIRYVKGSKNYVYVTCHGEGIFVVDVANDTNPVLFNNGAKVFTSASGNPKGGCVDVARDLFFIGTEGGNSGVEMWDFTDPLDPQHLHYMKTQFRAFEMLLRGNYLFVVQDDTLEVFDTSDNKNLASVASCCGLNGPSMYAVGIAQYGDMIYTSDHAGALVVVINATDPENPFYVGHQDAKTGVGGKEGMVAAKLGDGFVGGSRV
ncbi:hypothetical protein DIPPA_32279 [Diplonema papillatum]|nr:hypothetical protein DIPPA_32279 [Diplonema papillatum]